MVNAKNARVRLYKRKSEIQRTKLFEYETIKEADKENITEKYIRDKLLSVL